MREPADSGDILDRNIPVDEDGEAPHRELTGLALRATMVLSVALTLFHLYTGGAGAFANLMQRAPHVGLALAIGFLLYPARRGASQSGATILDWILAALALVSCFYVVVFYDRIMTLGYVAQPADLLMGTILTLLILEAGRRVVGWFFPALAVFSLLYAFFGAYFPGIWAHRGLPADYIVEILYITDRGIWGMVTGISATVIAMYVIFGSVLMRTGGGQTFIDFSVWASGRSVGGAAKVATIASSLFGTVSGSAGANVATTGVFTIPLMRSLRYRPEFAAGVEAVASTGGQIMPPIMGAGAFIMAELIGVPYLSIAVAAIFPALLYYGGTFAAIHFEALRSSYARVPEEQIPTLRSLAPLHRSLPVVLPLAVLIVLLVQGYTPSTCAFWSIATSLAIFVAMNLRPSRLAGLGRGLLDIAVISARGLVAVVVLIVCAQIIIAMISTTGVGVKFSTIIIELGSENLLLSLVLAMVIAMILGMGLPTAGAYLLSAAVVAPALVRLGLEPLPAHLFVFYFSILAGITPPICATVFIAASMANADWLKTAWVSMRLALPAFLVPYLFVNSPALLLSGEPWRVALAVITACVGVVALAAAAMGFMRTLLPPLSRIVLLVGAFLLIIPGWRTDLAGIVLVGIIVASQLRWSAAMDTKPAGE